MLYKDVHLGKGISAIVCWLDPDVHTSLKNKTCLSKTASVFGRHVPPFAKTWRLYVLASLMSPQRHRRCQRQIGYFSDAGRIFLSFLYSRLPVYLIPITSTCADLYWLFLDPCVVARVSASLIQKSLNKLHILEIYYMILVDFRQIVIFKNFLESWKKMSKQ